LNVVETVLGFTNISFVAKTIDWNPAHMYQTLHAAYRHKGLSFVQILQRCPTYTPHMFDQWRNNPDSVRLLVHDEGVPVDPPVARMYTNTLEHDPSDLATARQLAGDPERIPIGLLYRNPDARRYDEITVSGLDMPVEEKLQALERELDRFAI
ncbi:MAG: 2-oxoglutarate oxidoreductase, partial [bacterium]|nr:2-oxoglutarate oxidoreductase [bacterium]